MPETKLEPRTPRAEPAPQQPKSHGLALKDRRHLAVTGVSRVISCDENTAVLETPLGNLTIGGQELQIGELSPTIFSITYIPPLVLDTIPLIDLCHFWLFSK